MTDQQLYIALGAPILFNGVLLTVIVLYINAKLDGMMHLMNERFKGIDAPLDGMNQRFDDLRDLWRAELHRVEEVLGAPEAPRREINPPHLLAS
jgi:hypothetical protein